MNEFDETEVAPDELEFVHAIFTAIKVRDEILTRYPAPANVDELVQYIAHLNLVETTE